MIIEQYGIRLIRLQEEDIELVRFWRNHPKIKTKMAFKKHITQKMQLQWFNSINNRFNYYFIIEHKDKKIGLINTKNINFEAKYGEGGIFIWEENLEHEFVSVFASLCFINYHFLVLQKSNKSFIQILKTNEKAINYNQKLGYVLIPGQENVKNQYYILTKEDYLKKTKKLNKIAQKITGDYALPRVSGNTDF